MKRRIAAVTTPLLAQMQPGEPIHFLTAKGLKEFQKRLKYLVEVRRSEISERLRLAMDEGGDLNENAEYLDAKREQAFIEGEIERIECILSNAQMMHEAHNKHRVQLGSVVTILEKGSRQPEIYLLVDSAETNPRGGKISIASPLGNALLGAKVGDKVIVTAPDNRLIFVVKAIR